MANELPVHTFIKALGLLLFMQCSPAKLPTVQSAAYDAEGIKFMALLTNVIGDKLPAWAIVGA